MVSIPIPAEIIDMIVTKLSDQSPSRVSYNGQGRGMKIMPTNKC